MISTQVETQRWSKLDLAAVLARLSLGMVFLYLGLNKALHPVEFLKLVRQYDAIQSPLMLNLIASALPWVEVFCGCLLLLGIAVRGTAVILLAMLIPFTALVLQRALAMSHSGGLPLCAIKFDCGCGTGEVFICRKLGENALLALLAACLIWWRRGALCLRHSLWQ